MPADANIFQQYLNPPKSVLDYQNEYDQADARRNALAQSAQALQKGSLELQTTQQGIQRANALRDLVANLPTDPLARIAALRSANTPESWGAADALEKSQAERSKQAAETNLATSHAGLFDQQKSASQATQLYEAAMHHAQGLAYVKTPEDVRTYLQQGISKGVFPPMSPDQIEQKLSQFSSVEEFKEKSQEAAIPVIDKLKIDAENERNKLNNETSRANNAATVGEAKREHDLVNARTRESNAATMSKPFEVTGPDGAPMLVQQGKNGTITPVKGYTPKGNDKALTEGQSKAALFGSRMQSSHEILGKLAQKGITTSPPGASTGIGNMIVSPDQQKMTQAKRDFVNAVLRRESGASISASEFDNAEKQYFPQMGDSPAVIAQKANNRAIAIRGMQAEIPKNQRGIVGDIIGGDQQAASPAKTGAVVNFSDLK